MQRLVETTSILADDSAATAQGDAARATELEAAADNEVVTAADVTRRYDQLSDALAEAGASLTQLSDHARTLAVAEQAAARLQALAASAGASEADRVATAHAAPIPADFRKLYVGSAKTCQRPVLDGAGGHRTGRVGARAQRVDVLCGRAGADAVPAVHVRGVRRRR